MAYNFDIASQQLQDLQRQYQQLYNSQQPQNNLFQQPIQPPIPSRQVQYVEGIEGARIYQQNLPSNSSEIIMDKEENIFYYVSKDANGTPSKRIPVGHFSIQDDIQEEPTEPTFLTRKDLDEFKEEIRRMFAEAQSQPQTQKPSAAKSSTTKKD